MNALTRWGASTVFFLLLPIHAHSGGVVTNCTETDLRAAMSGGGKVTFACDGTIKLTHTLTNSADTSLDAAGHLITLSGGNAVRVLHLSSNVSLTISSLTIANGQSDNGAGIYNAGGSLTLQNCVLLNNSATGTNGLVGYGDPAGNAYGGAVYNLGFVRSFNCAFLSNSAVGGLGGWASLGPGGAGGFGNGGAVANFGTFIATGGLLAKNRAVGGEGGSGGSAAQGGQGGDGAGAAVANFGVLTLSSCLVTSNSSTGGMGGNGGSGNYFPGSQGTPGGSGGASGAANGALFNHGSAFFVNDTFAQNSGAGGQGGAGGSGGPPWNQSTSSGNGGNGASGGSGYGAIVDGNGQCYLTNCTLAFNQGIAGTGGPGGPPGPWPYPYPPRLGQPGANGSSGPPGSGLYLAGTYLVNTILASNSPANGSGGVTDAGHNLSSDASVAFADPGSLTNANPRLAPLANNGGLTLTMALMPGSPAIDAGDTPAAPLTDQRGFPRPAGSAADVGAFEYGSMLPVLSIARASTGLLNIQVKGNSNQWCRLQASSNLADWVPIATNQIGPDGTLLFRDSYTEGLSRRFYRVVMP